MGSEKFGRDKRVLPDGPCNKLKSHPIGKLIETSRIRARVVTYAHQLYALMPGQLAGAFSLNEISAQGCACFVLDCRPPRSNIPDLIANLLTP